MCAEALEGDCIDNQLVSLAEEDIPGDDYITNTYGNKEHPAATSILVH